MVVMTLKKVAGNRHGRHIQIIIPVVITVLDHNDAHPSVEVPSACENRALFRGGILCKPVSWMNENPNFS